MAEKIVVVDEARSTFKNFINDLEVDKLRLGLKEPNIFQILGIAHHEIRHSNFLAWLLDPNAGHGLGSVFIQKILREIFSDDKSKIYDEFYVDNINYSQIELFREWKHFSSGAKDSLDLLIKHPNFIIAIENKIWSTDGVDQLKKYKKMIEECYPEYKDKSFYIYLTPEGIKPIDLDGGADYIILSYKIIITYLKNIISIYEDSISNHVKHYIKDYITILSREIMGDEQLAEYARNIYSRHRNLIDFIVEYGASTDFKEAYDDFKGKNFIKPLYSNKNLVFSFLPTKIEEKIKFLIDSQRTKMGNTYGKEYPLFFWFETDKNESYLRLIIEIGPFKDNAQREMFKELIIDKLSVRGNFSSTTFTRVYTDKITFKDVGNDKYKNAMQVLYSKKQVQDFINDFSSIDFLNLNA